VDHGNKRRYGARDQSTSQEDYLGHYMSLIIGLNGTFAGWDTLLVCLLFLGAFCFRGRYSLLSLWAATPYR